MCFFSYSCHPSFFCSTALSFPLSLLYIFSLQMMLLFTGFNGSSSDTIQARSNSDFDVKRAPIKFYDNNHNSQSDRWIGLKFYVEPPDMLSYLGINFQVNWCLKSIETRVNRGCMNFVIYFLLTCELPIWLGFFS